MKTEYDHIPDKWVIITDPAETQEEYKYRILSGWYGGYLGSDRWRISSGIIKITEHKTFYEIHNVTGSTYKCFKNNTGLSSYTAEIYNHYKKTQNIVIIDDIMDLPIRYFTGLDFPA
jgi:hypothetical protein